MQAEPPSSSPAAWMPSYQDKARAEARALEDYHRTDPERAAARWFFADLEWHSNWRLVALHDPCGAAYRDSIETVIGATLGVLTRRIRIGRRRFGAWLRGAPAPDANAWPVLPRRTVVIVSELVRWVLYRHFLSEDGSLDAARAGRAFLSFANRELRWSDAATVFDSEPNGAQYFCMTEFAFLAVECGVDVEMWERLLPALVCSQEVYRRVYRSPIAHCARWHCFDASNGEMNARISDAEIATMLDAHRGLTHERLQQLSTRCVQSSLADDP